MEMSKDSFIKALLDAAEINGIASLLDEKKAELLFALTERMLSENEKYNLTAIKDPTKIIFLHYVDCLLEAALFPKDASVIDVGCGAGFPSLPLAICRPDLKITALDSTAKRVLYVEETARLLGLTNVKTVTARAEDAARLPSLRERFDCATARAVAALPVLCEICLPFVKKEGLFIAMKGKNAKEELSASLSAIKLLGGVYETLAEAPIVDFAGEQYARGTVLIRKKTATNALYPRPYAKIVKKPL